jgi:hypothetical protein
VATPDRRIDRDLRLATIGERRRGALHRGVIKQLVLIAESGASLGRVAPAIFVDMRVLGSASVGDLNPLRTPAKHGARSRLALFLGLASDT